MLFNKKITLLYLALGLISLYSILGSFIWGFPNELTNVVRIVYFLGFITLIGIIAFAFKKWRYSFESLLIKLNIAYIFIVALLVRVIWVIISDNHLTSDYEHFNIMAIDILNGQYWFNPYKPTGTSIFVALIYKLMGYNEIAPRVAIAILGSIQVLLVYDIVLKVSKSKKAGLIGGLILCFFPEHLIYSNLIGSDLLFSFLALVTVWLVIKFRFSKNLLYLILAGLTISIAHYVRLVSFIFYASIVIYFILGFKRKEILKNIIVFSLVYGLALIPIVSWNINNNKTFSIMPAHQQGINIIIGSNQNHYGRCKTNLEDYETYHKFIAKAKGSLYERMITANDSAKFISKNRFLDKPLKSIGFIVKYKIPGYWGRTAGINNSLNNQKFDKVRKPIVIISDTYYKLILFLFAFSIVRFRKHIVLDELTIFLFSSFILFVLHSYVESDPRYHFTMTSFFCIMIPILYFQTKNDIN